jgi:hypothetical protein
MAKAKKATSEWPPILDRYVVEVGKSAAEYKPRRVRRRFHGIDVTGWEGLVHVDDVEGWVDNNRIRFYLNQWRQRVGDPDRSPTSDEIYEIMVDADQEEKTEGKKPFHVDRIAKSICRNGITEPIVLSSNGGGPATLWDGNRRFYGVKHIMKDGGFREFKVQAQWIPAFVIPPTGDPLQDNRLRHAILTEMNFVEKDHIPWPAYVKAAEIHDRYEEEMVKDPDNPSLSRQVKDRLAEEYGLKGWRVADRWIKMYNLAMAFKEYHEEEHSRDDVEVDLCIQDKFEYFDELSKSGVWGCLAKDPDARDEVFCWLWDGKFKAFPDVRMVPHILANPVARAQANSGDADGVKRAIQTVIADDPARVKSKEAAGAKIKQFAEWLESFKPNDFEGLDAESLKHLKSIVTRVTKMLEGLLSPSPEERKSTHEPSPRHRKSRSK